MSVLTEFMSGAASQHYRDLVQHHLRKQSTEQLITGLMGTVELLPDKAQRHAMEFTDAVIDRIGYDQHFWRHADVKTAFGYVIQEAIKTLDISEWMSAEVDAYQDENHELAFNLFQIATLNFAYSASMDRKQRKFMGIRKGIFG